MPNQSPPEVVLIRYSLILQPDGRVRSQVDNVDPNKFLEVVDKDWQDAPNIARAIKYLIAQFVDIDERLDKFIGSI